MGFFFSGPQSENKRKQKTAQINEVVREKKKKNETIKVIVTPIVAEKFERSIRNGKEAGGK